MKSKDLIKSGKFNNLYNMSKTLRFGLKPINETEEHIVNGLIFPSKANGNKIDDKTRAKHYTIVKQMLNEMHRNFIAEALSTENVRKYFSKNKKAVEAIKSCYKNWKENGDISSEQKILIGDLKKIFGTTAARWKENYETSKIHENNKSSTIKKTASILCDGENTLVLLEWQIETGKIKLAKEEEKGHYYSKDEMLKFLHSFKKFSVYFDGFNENRKNVYSFELISTSIAHRLFERNIKIHFENIKKWETIQVSLKTKTAAVKINKTDKEEKKISEILKEKKVDYKKLLKNITLTGKTEEAEINLEKKLEHFFSPEAFLEYLSYDAIENEYNLVIGGLPAQTTREKPRGINEIINTEIRQKAHASRHQFPVLEPLHKQILSKKTAFIDEFNSKEEMFEAIRSFHNNPDNAASEQSASVLTIAKDFRDDMENYLDKELETKEARAAHFLPRKTVETMSIELCGYWNTLNEQWADYLDHQDMRKKEKDQRSKQKAFSFLELEELFKYIQQNQDTVTTSNEDSQHGTGFTKEWQKIECAEILKKYINKQLKGIIDTGMEHETSEGEKIKKESIVTAWADLNKSKILENVPDALNKDHVIKVKAYLDSCLRFSGFVRALKVRDKDVSKIQKEQHENWCEIQILNELLKKFPVIDLYNKCRNFITKKDYQESKFKLTFQNPTLARGWDRNKERDNSCIMLKKDGQYFLGIMSKECNDLFTDKNLEKLEQEKDSYQKMIYRQIASAGKDVQTLIKIGEETVKKMGKKKYGRNK